MKPTFATLLLGGLVLAGEAFGQDAEAGRQIAGMCRTCHGLDGIARIPIAPHIGGEPAAYLAAQLLAFKEGRRDHEMMSVVAGTLTEQQIADVAAWYSSIEAEATLAASSDDAPERCAECHGADGMALVEDVPNLAGETAMYIDTQLKAFRTGKRHHEVMSYIAAGMSDDEIRAVAEWFQAVGFSTSLPAAAE